MRWICLVATKMDSSTLAVAAAGSLNTVLLKVSKAVWHAMLCTGIEMKWEYSSLYALSFLLAAYDVKKSATQCHLQFVTLPHELWVSMTSRWRTQDVPNGRQST